MTYDDYRVLRFSEHNRVDFRFCIPKEYKGLTRTVIIRWVGDEFSIKGIFSEYPDAWIKGVVNENKVFFEPTQVLQGTDCEQIYFHSGIAEYELLHDWTFTASQISVDASKRSVSQNRDTDFTISNDKKEISAYMNYAPVYGDSFWLSMNKEEDPINAFYTKWRDGRIHGTGFPESERHMVNMVFRKISEVPTENEVVNNPETK